MAPWEAIAEGQKVVLSSKAQTELDSKRLFTCTVSLPTPRSIRRLNSRDHRFCKYFCTHATAGSADMPAANCIELSTQAMTETEMPKVLGRDMLLGPSQQNVLTTSEIACESRILTCTTSAVCIQQRRGYTPSLSLRRASMSTHHAGYPCLTPFLCDPSSIRWLQSLAKIF